MNPSNALLKIFSPCCYPQDSHQRFRAERLTTSCPQSTAVNISKQCRETRYFSTWKRKRQYEEHHLPDVVRRASRGSQASVPFGDAVLAFEDSVLGVETCEELFTPAAPHIDLALSGVEIISNSSGSHHQVSIVPGTETVSADGRQHLGGCRS